jgi:hypothetical protein
MNCLLAKGEVFAREVSEYLAFDFKKRCLIGLLNSFVKHLELPEQRDRDYQGNEADNG